MCREGETAWGGWNGIGRVLLLRVFPGRAFVSDVITLRGRNDPPDCVVDAGYWLFCLDACLGVVGAGSGFCLALPLVYVPAAGLAR